MIEASRAKNITDKLSRISEHITLRIQSENNRRTTGLVPRNISIHCGICTDEQLVAIIHEFASDNGVRCDGFQGFQFPTNIPGPDNEKVWLIYDLRKGINITTKSMLSQDEYTENSKDSIYVRYIDSKEK